MKETYKTDFEKIIDKINKAQMEANAIADKVIEEMPLGTIISVEDCTLYANSTIYSDLFCAIYEIIKNEDGVCVRTEYDECIDIHELVDKLYNDVILYIINNL